MTHSAPPEPADTCNVAAALARQAAERPDAPAIHYPVGMHGGKVDYRTTTYRELDELSDAYARGLGEYGIGRGVRTALMVPPGLEFFALFFALFKAGTVPVLIDPGIGLKPLKKCLREAKPEAFIGITKAQVARAILRWSPGTIRRKVTVGPRVIPGGITTKKLAAMGQRSSGAALADTQPDDMAAVLFTSGSTGIPKGVVYRHRHFVSQVDMLRNAFGIEAGEIDLPTFPPFALFDPALGMTTVVPWMDPTRPAKADPDILARTIMDYGVTNVFGSPALLKVLSRHTEDKGLILPTVRRVISAGAAVPTATVRRMQAALTGDADVHTPYGATECLPVASISGRELDTATTRATAGGAGICVGRPVAPNKVCILPVDDGVIETLDEDSQLPTGEIGEVTVHGPTTTDAYWRRDEATRLAKSTDSQGQTWHRMGDIGYLDEDGRLWYCGRKSQRVRTANGDLFADQVEAIFNAHPEVERTALVGVGEPGRQTPVLCLEWPRSRGDSGKVLTELHEMAGKHASLAELDTILLHEAFPVDIRHNSKIGREALTQWAQQRV